MVKITILSPDGGHVSCELQPNENLLSGLLKRDVQVPYCCTVGICGMCKADLNEGDVALDHDSLAALTEQEIGEGRLLLCCARAVADSTVTLVNTGGAERPRMMKGRIEAMTRLDQRWWHTRVRLTAGAVRRLLEKSERLTLKGAQEDGQGFRLKGWAGAYRDGLLDIYLDERVERVVPTAKPDVVLTPETGGSGVIAVTEPPALTLVVLEGDGVIRLPGLLQLLLLGDDRSQLDIHLLDQQPSQAGRWVLERLPGTPYPVSVGCDTGTLATTLRERIARFREEGGEDRAIRAHVYGNTASNAELRKVLLTAGLKPWKISVFNT